MTTTKTGGSTATSKSKGKKKKKRSVGKVILGLLILIILVALIIFWPKIQRITELYDDACKIASTSSLNDFNGSQTTIINDKDGNEIGSMRDTKDMYYVAYEDIPENLVNAFVVMEDRDYYKHQGVDYKAIIRAVIANQKANDIVQGASTITQQLARNIYLSQEVSWERKVEEIFLAQELEAKYSKEQILEFYLNNIYFGNGYYGVQAASLGYFQKTIDQLDLSEMAFIAAIPNNPTKYNPLTNYDNTVYRRNIILHELYEYSYISELDYLVAENEVVSLNAKSVAATNNSVVTYARHCATEALMDLYGFDFRSNFTSDEDYDGYCEDYEAFYTYCQQLLISGGYIINTSIDMSAQNALQESVDENLSWSSETGDGGVYSLQGAATSIDNKTGLVVAIVGARSQDLVGLTLNRAYQSYRQPGSSIKPLICYLPYLQLGHTPDSIVVDEYIENGPANADGYYAGEMTLRDAVKLSKNTVAWKIFQEITPSGGISFLLNMGFHKVWMDKEYNAAALGGFTYGVSTVEMAAAYATIENDGYYRKATCINNITTVDNTLVWDHSQIASERIYETNACRMMTSMLETVVESGTGVGASCYNAVIAGKTGTTNSNKDAWFVGYSAYYTTSVWIGYDYPQTLSSVNTKAIFKQYMEYIHSGLEKKNFESYEEGATDSTTEASTSAQSESVDSNQGENTTNVDANENASTKAVDENGVEIDAGGNSDGDSNAGSGAAGSYNDNDSNVELDDDGGGGANSDGDSDAVTN